MNVPRVDALMMQSKKTGTIELWCAHCVVLVRDKHAKAGLPLESCEWFRCSEYPLPRAQVKQQRCDFCTRVLEPITVV